MLFCRYFSKLFLRFQVDPQNEESDESNDSQEDRELLENEYDTKYGKSFRSVCIAPNLVTQRKNPVFCYLLGLFS